MLKGLIAQLMIGVIRTGFVLRPARATRAKSIFTMIGYIMKKRHTAMGIDTTGAPSTSRVSPSRARATPGATRPRAMPPRMQRPTQTVR